MTQTQTIEWLIFTLKPLDKELLKTELKRKCDATASFRIKAKESKLKVYQHVYQLSVAMSSNEFRHKLIAAFDSASQSLMFDYCQLNQSNVGQQIKLAAFDMDSTLIPMEVIDELANEAGVKSQVAAITEAAMRGDLDFNQSFEQRLSLLKGMSEQAVDTVKSRLRFNPGVETLISYLTQQGATVCIASGGFVPFAALLADRAPISKITANQLEFEQGKLTGNAVKPIINAEGKAVQLQQWQKELGVDKHETLAVGDGANDSQMLAVAGLGVAYKAKPVLRKLSDCVIEQGEMDGLVDILHTLKNI